MPCCACDNPGPCDHYWGARANSEIADRAMSDYESADYYDATDNPEHLTYSSPEEAIAYMLDGWVSPERDIRDVIAEHGACTVVAWARKELSDADIMALAAQAADDFCERLDDEYGGPEYPLLEAAELRALAEKLAPIFREAVEATTIWACEECGRREYTAEETEALMREHCPEWFEEPSDE